MGIFLDFYAVSGMFLLLYVCPEIFKIEIKKEIKKLMRERLNKSM